MLFVFDQQNRLISSKILHTQSVFCGKSTSEKFHLPWITTKKLPYYKFICIFEHFFLKKTHFCSILHVLHIQRLFFNSSQFFRIFFNAMHGPSGIYDWPGIGAMRSLWQMKGPWTDFALDKMQWSLNRDRYWRKILSRFVWFLRVRFFKYAFSAAFRIVQKNLETLDRLIRKTNS